eukprot:TRINITY_DN6846_c0_g1_i1.p1 TRINITY_DN6846_c0_g1~~TRINITY_DN6846_c0_g1_i1.p1  ORF type:complete len:162 (-),score=26.17 TRINITY_DN6846_c0_g1_i1:79-564(-)
MVRSGGLRSNTRHLFSKSFRKSGPVHLSTYLVTYKVGDYVDIKADSSIHKGMPHKYYHGKTGIVWNVTPRAVGVEVNKLVGNRIMKKRIHVRVEHVQRSSCRDHFVRRLKENEQRKKAIRDNKEVRVPTLKRSPGWPKEGKVVAVKGEIETIRPVPYEFIV